MDLKLPKTYKLLLALTAVIGPFIWLVFTEDGQRRTDLVLLHLFGRPSFNLAHERLGPGITEDLLRTQFPRVAFDCVAARSAFGDRVCAASIGAFSGIPARTAQIYYAGDALRAVRIDYRARYHDLLRRTLIAAHGQPRPTTAGDGEAAVLDWSLPGGLLLLPRTLSGPQDAALMWIGSGSAAAGDG
ncbi:MAG: hypothetical protein EA400_06435 [Chromatiaceae bacterium]|nr:MAG: hypothetical protein EA400_06435 [Chromatiaceae bacterium]